jgi:hypothetical protein
MVLCANDAVAKNKMTTVIIDFIDFDDQKVN